MKHKGFSHIGLSTLDLDKTRAFYEGVLGFKPVGADTITIEEGGHLRHMFFDVGGGQLIAFLAVEGEFRLNQRKCYPAATVDRSGAFLPTTPYPSYDARVIML